jgi:hypothetical protein
MTEWPPERDKGSEAARSELSMRFKERGALASVESRWDGRGAHPAQMVCVEGDLTRRNEIGTISRQTWARLIDASLDFSYCLFYLFVPKTGSMRLVRSGTWEPRVTVGGWDDCRPITFSLTVSAPNEVEAWLLPSMR